MVPEIHIEQEQEEQLQVYEMAVKDLAINRSTMPYLNSGKHHAAIVLENILLQSKRVKMFAGNLNENICSDENDRFGKALQYFLVNKGEIKIILNEFDTTKNISNNVLGILKQYQLLDNYKNNIQVKLTEEKPAIDGKDIHYTVGDDSMYRLEYDTKSYKAIFCFNDTKKSLDFSKKFDQSFASATDLQLSSL